MSWRLVVAVVSLILPWTLRRQIFILAFGYKIDRTAFIGRSIVMCRQLTMGPHSSIGDLTFIRWGVESVTLGPHASLGGLNWVSARPLAHDILLEEGAIRSPELVLDEHASVTNRHIIECSDRIHLGAFSTIGGWRSQVITRGLDIRVGRQAAEPITIGRYCLVATGSIVLKGTSIPDYSVLAAGSVLAHKMTETYSLYSGVPAVRVRALDPQAAYFRRTSGPVP
jgi:acetyltransferase-like isoleucine patch superfamily enzyme